jgi:hypothetical protein
VTKKQEKAINQLHEDFGKLLYKWKSDNNIEASLVLSLAIPIDIDKHMLKLHKKGGIELMEPLDSVTMYLTVYQSEREKFFKNHVHSLIDGLRASYGDEYDKQNLSDYEEFEG